MRTEQKKVSEEGVAPGTLKKRLEIVAEDILEHGKVYACTVALVDPANVHIDGRKNIGYVGTCPFDIEAVAGRRSSRYCKDSCRHCTSVGLAGNAAGSAAAYYQAALPADDDLNHSSCRLGAQTAPA